MEEQRSSGIEGCHSKTSSIPGAPLSGQIAITRTVTVAAGRFAPGHLGELTRLVPFEMVDDALARTAAVQRRIRLLPARVVVYLLLAGCLFAELGYVQVWQRLTAGLGGLADVVPTASALRQARQRLGVAPLRALFDLLRGPAATASTAVWWRGLLLVAVDGTTMTVADSPANLAEYVRQRGLHGGSGYPMMRLSTLVACGTRSLIDAVFDPISRRDQPRRSAGPQPAAGDAAAGRPQLRRRRPDRQARHDRRRSAHPMQDQPKTADHPPPERRLIPVPARRCPGPGHRCADQHHHQRRPPHRLLPTRHDLARTPPLAGHRTGHPLHQRWEIETAYLELKSSILGGRVLRARTPAGVDQEVHALLITYQLLRTAMVNATDSQPGVDPDRASFIAALHAARDQVVHAAGVITDTVIDLVGVIGRHVLANLQPPRRVRTKARTVKRPNSKYQARGPHIDRTSYPATINIDILTAEP
ncbi:transposase [Micromonospora kangleipakensis]|uniref:transposase n=1 Tax=Micromonospora kangleipakensis TaxID=1077942 RepID=UPI001F5EC139|nr:transposase [Micromonospora kangleipakensis]